MKATRRPSCRPRLDVQVATTLFARHCLYAQIRIILHNIFELALHYCPAARYLGYFIEDNEWSAETASTAASTYGIPGVQAVAASVTRAKYVYTLVQL